MTGSLYALASGATAASVAFRTLLASTGIGLAVVGITSAITYLTSKFSESIQEGEKFDTYLKNNELALTDNKARVDELLESYEALDNLNTRQGGLTAEDNAEYLNVQNQLAELFPAIIDYVDANGNAHLKSREAIDREIESTTELIKKQRELEAGNAEESFEDLSKELDKINKKRDQFNTILELKIEKGNSPENIAETEYELLKLDRQFADVSAELSNNIINISDAFIEFGTELNSVIDGEIRDAISGLDFSQLDPEQLKGFSKELATIRVALNEALEAGDEDAFNKARQDLQALFSTSATAGKELNGLSLSFDKVAKATANIGESANPVVESLEDAQTASEGLSKKLSDLYETMEKLTSVEEQLVGVSYGAVTASEDLVFIYEQLTNQLQGYSEAELQSLVARQKAGDSLTTSEQQILELLSQRGETIAQLSALYPELAKLEENAVSLTYKQIEAIQKEEKANKVLLQAYKLSREGKLSAEQDATLATAMGTKARILEIEKEIKALILLQEQIENTKLTNQEFIDGVNDGSLQNQGSSFFLPGQVEKQIETKTVQLSELRKLLDSSVGSIDAFSTSISESDKTTKDSNKSTRESAYYTDVYKQAIEELNLAIAKQQSLRDGQLQHSKTYIDSLQKELELENKRLKLMQEQAKSLEKQIKSGKIAQTGNVSFDSGTSTTSSSGGKVSVNGFGGKITSGQGYRIHPVTGQRSYHEGIDIAGARGSRLDSIADGRVVASDYNSISGNYVKIEDSKGYQAFYGHLDQAFAKLGDVVKAGQQIGTIGSTGRSTGSHLHFQVSKNGQLQSALDYTKDARNGQVNSSGGTDALIKTSTGAVATNQQAIDGAKSDLLALQSDILDQQKRVSEIQRLIFDANRSGFEYKRNNADATIEYEQAKLENVDFASSRYGKTLGIITKQLEIKQKANADELAFLTEYSSKNKLSKVELDEINQAQLALKQSTQELIAELARVELNRVNNNLENNTRRYTQTIEYERAKITELDTASARYGKTLEIITRNLQANSRATKNTIQELNILIQSGKYTGAELQNMKDRVHELTLEVNSLAREISDNNFEIIVNIKTNADSAVDDIDFLLARSQALQKFTTEGSAEYNAEIITQVGLYRQIAEARDASRRALEQELQQRDLLPERIKEITELLEDESTAYLSALTSIQSLVKGAEESSKNQLEKIYNDVVKAYKDYIQERRDEHFKQLDDERKLEDDNHERRKKQLSDELALFRKNIDERLELLDRQDAERSYSMEIDELEEERRKLDERRNLLLLDNSREAGVERQELSEQIDKIDKDISERQYQRDLELQKQGLNDLADDKEREIDLLEEAEDRRYKIETERIDKLKRYYEKYYNDLLNDERRFAQLRSDILNGNFEKIASDFAMYIGEMQATLPLLEDTFDGTMMAVGTAIRLNVIDNLQNALKLFDEFKTSQNSLSGIGANLDGFTDNFDPNKYKPTGQDSNFTGISGSGGATQGVTFTVADAKVIVGKYFTEVLRKQEPNPTRAESIRNKAYSLAQQGRNEGSKIPADQSLSATTAKLSSQEKSIVQSYINSNIGNLLQTDYLIDSVKKFGASLDTGGYLNFRGSGIDGKGGRAIIGHPDEIMLNPIEVDELLQHSKNLKELFNVNGGFSKLLNGGTSGSTAPVQEIYNVSFGDVHNTTQNGAKQFARDLINETKLRKGGY